MFADVTLLISNADGKALLDMPVGRPIEEDGIPVCYFPLSIGCLV